MATSLYSQHEFAQFRGPTTSDRYNERIENLYKDLMSLYNKVGLNAEQIRLFNQRLLKHHLALTQVLEDLEARISAIEAENGNVYFTQSTQIDNDRFDETSFEISESSRLSWDSQHNVMTLPKITSSSVSLLYLVNSDGSTVIPSTFEAVAQGVSGTADSTNAVIDTSDIFQCVSNDIGQVWERNVIVDAPHANGAEVDLSVRFPTDIGIASEANCVILHPFPMMGCDITSIKYTTQLNVGLNSSDTYKALNAQEFASGDDDAVGYVPPGAWTDDAILSAGPRIFYFDPIPMTGLKIRLRQPDYYAEGTKYIYSYGLSKLDVRYDKFQDTGRVMIRFDAPTTGTISEITNVNPLVYNVSQGEKPYIFSYRVIYETSYNSGSYTLTPVAFSQRAWVELTLQKTVNGGTPMLAGVKIEYV